MALRSPENDLQAYFCGPKYRGSGAASGLDVEDAEVIDGILGDFGLGHFVKVDRSRLHDSHEAWVYVLIQEAGDLIPFLGFDPYPRSGVLTWCNSD